ncbi:MAG: DUF2782 domain-containing protein [Gammaproteobacteria bacterium]|nr:DUF2782 domain-containing protein [Gammaproteobacteria bacterium]
MPIKHLASSCILLATALATVTAAAQEEQPPERFPEAPPPPPKVQSGEALEPEVTIIRRETQTIEEYRVNGQLYMIRVKPDIGPTYYLVDADGDGNLETRRHELDPGFRIPGWVLFRW